MPPFEYAPYRNPYVGSMSELMMRPAEAQGQAAVQAGQAWAGAASNIGQAVSGAIHTATDPQQVMARQQVSDLQLLDKAYQQPGGRDQILAKLPGHLKGQVAAQFTAADEAAAKLQKAQLEAEQATNDYTVHLAETIKAHGYDPVAAQFAFSHARQTFGSNPSLSSQVNQLEQAFYQNPTTGGVKAMIDPILAAHAAQEKPVVLPGAPRPGAGASTLVNPSTGDVKAIGSPAVPDESTGEYTINGQRFKKDGTPIGPLVPTQTAPKAIESKNVLLDGKPAIVNFDPASGKHTLPDGTDVSERVKPIPPASMTINPATVPSGDALDMAARRYLATGELPAMGMGQAGAAARVAVMNAAAKIDPQASLAANKATYGADSKNLANLQKTEGTLSAFENTAGKNLDQFLTLAAKIPDTGSPWINAPLRSLTASAVGSANQAAFNAARDVALREIARVTSDPKLSGALTDSARQEVAALSPANATFAQIKKVAQVLKQDMANVHSGINEQIATVKAGLTNHPGAPASNSTAPAGTVRVKGPNGETGTMPVNSVLPSGWTKE